MQVHREPVDTWMNIKGFDLLQALYTDSDRWSFAFEMSALLSRIKSHANANHSRIHIYERSILSCFHVFIRHDLAQRYLNETEHRILQEHFEYGLQKTMDLSHTMILYFDLPPKECLKRITQRSRQSESTIDLTRLEQLREYYDNFIQNFHQCPVKIIDASQSMEQTMAQVDSLLKQFIPQSHLDSRQSCMDQSTKWPIRSTVIHPLNVYNWYNWIKLAMLVKQVDFDHEMLLPCMSTVGQARTRLTQSVVREETESIAREPRCSSCKFYVKRT